MDFREVGDGFVALDGDRALAIEGDAAAAYREGGWTRRQLLTRIGAGAAVAGVSYVALPMAYAAASGPTASITPNSGPKGTVVSLTGSGFAPNKLITVTVAGVTATMSPAAVTTDASGNIPAGTTFTVPDTGTNLGSQPVAVIVNGVSTSAGNFTISTPTVTVTPTSFTKHTGSGNGSSTFTVTASSGFLAGATFSFAGTGAITVTKTSGPSTVAAGGTLPTGPYGFSYTNGAGTSAVKFTDSAGNTATVTFSFA